MASKNLKVPASYKFKSFFGSSNVSSTEPPATHVLHEGLNAVHANDVGNSNALCRKTTKGKGKDKVGEKRTWKDYDASRSFRVEWLVDFPWAEQEGKGKVRCKVCELIDKRPCIMDCKRDTLEKHEGKRYARIVIEGEEVESVFWATKNKHKENEKKYDALLKVEANQETIECYMHTQASQMFLAKKPQFACIFYLLNKGRPMNDFPQNQHLYAFLGVPSLPTKHWSVTSGWEMAECMDDLFQDRVRRDVHASSFLALSLDEVTTNDNTQWMAMHVYIVKNYRREVKYLCLSKIDGSSNAENLLCLVIENLKVFGGIESTNLGGRLMCVGCDGASVLQGNRAGLIIRLTLEHAPFVLGIHCMAHRTNLAGKIISKVALVSKIEGVIHDAYNYFSRSPKRLSEYKKEAEGLSKGRKLLRDVETRWISLYKPILRLYEEYRTLVSKMKKDCGDNVEALRVFEELIDIEIIGIPCVLPLLERMHMLVKLSQAQDVYVLDFVECIENTKKVLKEMYDLHLGFKRPKFKMWTSLVYGSDSWLDFNEKDELGIVFNNMFIIVKGGFEGQGVRHSRRGSVSNSVLLETIEHVKRECHAAANFLVQEINDRFPSHDLIEAFSIIYPQFWYSLTCEVDFLRHLKTLQASYCTQRDVDGCFYGPILDAEKLDSQSSFFIATMKAHVAKTPMEYAKEVTVTFLWKKLSHTSQLMSQIFEYAKLADLALVMIIGSVEDERTFSRLDFIKNKKRNRLDKHLDICVRAFEQKFYDINTFPFNEACNVWNDRPMRTRYHNSCIEEEEENLDGISDAESEEKMLEASCS
ncbi:hypothetical protein L7F22_052281 [Adiantum nelumboides]|nr:hypothetical protein [Adiantum nelumboides]